MQDGIPQEKELLIVSITPQNLERGVLWFQENLTAIRHARHSHPWWRANGLFLEKDLAIPPSLLARNLLDFGYERSTSVTGKGLFAMRGGIIAVWPINSDRPYAIEFVGNAIAEIVAQERPAKEVKPLYSHSQRPDTIASLPEGSFVVHIDHGIGIFRGISDNYFVIEYAPPAPGREPDRLFVPADQKDRLTPYVGFETPRVHRLGTTLWIRTRRKIKEETEKLARELLALYAARHEATRPAYRRDNSLEETLRNTFPFQETEDQLHVEEEIMHDLGRDRPMDRIVVGDVGFGKTELAIRASLAVIASGAQVAVLAPTTVLAAQHEKTFSERMADLPVTVRMLSRLSTGNQTKKTLEELRTGKVDCVIGTHRLLSRDVAFKNLGLVIIDEEQRFGVKQKERFKELRASVDILSLSATPIPRTMQIALAKLRDISMLSSPPPERLPINTSILPFTPRIVRDAIRYELARGGQAYVLHNRIETIGMAKEKLQKILRTSAKKERAPRIGVIHGRIGEKTLIKVMEQFRAKEIDILLATTIIENGLDISSANTLIVDDATRLGLAQAHQIRGRIGRGNVEAHAYFLYKPHHLTEKASERLKALQEYAELGAGYQLALRDLEIRGAGNILGREQSGAVNKVGLNLYYQMLAEAVEEMKTTMA